jgi:hypothetical protein
MVTIQTKAKHITEKELRFPAPMTALQFQEALEVVRAEWRTTIESSAVTELKFLATEDRFLKEVKVSANATSIVFSYEIVKLDTPTIVRAPSTNEA